MSDEITGSGILGLNNDQEKTASEKKKPRQSRSYAENPRDTAVFRGY